jgi:hypothetical protein
MRLRPLLGKVTFPLTPTLSLGGEGVNTCRVFGLGNRRAIGWIITGTRFVGPDGEFVFTKCSMLLSQIFFKLGQIVNNVLGDVEEH